MLLTAERQAIISNSEQNYDTSGPCRRIKSSVKNFRANFLASGGVVYEALSVSVGRWGFISLQGLVKAKCIKLLLRLLPSCILLKLHDIVCASMSLDSLLQVGPTYGCKTLTGLLTADGVKVSEMGYILRDDASPWPG